MDGTVAVIVKRKYEKDVIDTAFELVPPYPVSRSDLDLTVEIAREAIVKVARERWLF